MKKFLAAALLLTSYQAISDVVKLETNFGMMTEFDEPQIMRDGPYPNFTDTMADYRASDRGDSTSPCGDGSCDYFGFKFALTDTFIWNDGGYIDNYEDALSGDFYINAFAGGEKFSYLVEDTGGPWRYGSFYTEKPITEPLGNIFFTLTTVDDDPESIGGAFVFDYNRTKFLIGDKPLRMVPETGTFALFLAGAIGLCVRRQMKQQA